MSKMEKNISFQVFALPHTNKKAEKSPENGLPSVSLKRIFPGMPKRFSGCAIQEPDYNDLVQVRCNCTFSGSHWAGLDSYSSVSVTSNAAYRTPPMPFTLKNTGC